MAHKASRRYAEIGCDLQQVTSTPRCRYRNAARVERRIRRRTIASTSVPSPSQTGKVAPRTIDARTDESTSARTPAFLAAVLAAVAAACGLVATTLDITRSAQGDAPVAGVALAAVVALAPLVVVAALALVAVLVRRPAVTGALTAGYGAVAAGLAVLDFGLIVSPIDSNRLELFRPTTAEPLQAGFGAYLVTAAHVIAVFGGLLGLLAVNRASFADGYGHSARADLTGRASAVRIGGVAAFVAALAGLLGAATMFAPPYDSTDSIVLVPAVVDAPLTTAIGSAVVALAVLVVVAAALASISPTVAAGALLGAGLGVFGLAASRVAAGSGSGPTIDASAGAWIGTGAAVVLVAVALVALPVTAVRDRRGAEASIKRPELSGTSGAVTAWHIAAGISGAVAGVLLCAGGLLPVLDVPDGVPNPTILASRTAVIAGFVLVVASVTMFFSVLAGAVRPALGVLTIAAVMAAAGVLQSIVLATDIDAITLGSGGAATVVGVIVALLCGGAVLLAGSAERDDVDTSESRSAGSVGSVALVGGLVSAVGLGLPLYRGTDVTAASFGDFPLGWDAWGQALLAVTIVVATVVAARSRTARGTSLLVGTVFAMIVYLLGWPLTQARALEPVVGPGVLVGAVGTLILAVAAVLSARRGPQ